MPRPTILNAPYRRAFLFGRQTGLRSTSDAVDQVVEQLCEERARVQELQRDIAALRYQVAQRDTLAAFAKADSPTASVH